jgi:hypothetical protein
MKLIPKNWASFQHYKDRAPPWIKLHKDLLDDRKFQCLPVASRALAPMLWLLASESKDGSFDGSVEELAFRLRCTEKEIQTGLSPLIDKGFFLKAQDASDTLADSGLPATPEGEREAETKTEAEGSAEQASPPAFTIPLIDKTEHRITQAEVDEWAAAYPAVNVPQQIREMRAWSSANPSQRKTARGVNAFIVRWLAREQDKGGKPSSVIGVTVPGPTGPDPALLKIEQDSKRAAPPSPETLARMAELRKPKEIHA